MVGGAKARKVLEGVSPGEGYEYIVLDYARAAANAVTESVSVSDVDVKGRSNIDQTVGAYQGACEVEVKGHQH